MLQVLATSPSLRNGDLDAFRAQMEEMLTLRGVAMDLRKTGGDRVIGVSAGQVGAFATNPAIEAIDKAVAASKLPQVSDLLEDPPTGRPYLLIAVPVLQGGEVTHVLDLILEPANILHLVLQNIPEGWLASVVDRNMRVITRSRAPDQFTGRRATDEFMNGIRNSEGSFYGGLSLEGEQVFVAFQTSKLSGWTVSFAVPVAILDKPHATLMRTLLTMGALGILTSLLMALFYARMLSSALQGLARSAAAVGRESFSEPKLTRVQEIDDVRSVLVVADAELKRSSSRQTTLLAELDHRVKNTLAIIQSLVSQTFRSVTSPEQFRTAITGRVMALARSHEVLSTTNWESPELRHVADAVLMRESRQVFCDGPRILLRPKAVVAFSQSFHELLANAMRHGRLLTASGHIDLSWRVAEDGDALLIRWVETGGAADDSEADLEPGLGLTIVRICIERQLGGECEVQRDAESFVFTARVPMQSELGRNATLLN